VFSVVSQSQEMERLQAKVYYTQESGLQQFITGSPSIDYTGTKGY